MITFSNITAYFKTIAEKLKPISHTAKKTKFYRFEYDEVFTSLRSNLNTPAFVLESYNYGFTDNKTDNVLKNINVAFFLLDYCPDLTDYDKRQQIIDNLEAIGDEILRKMYTDKIKRNVSTVREFEIDKVQTEQFESKPANCVGIRYTFTLATAFDYELTTNKWNV